MGSKSLMPGQRERDAGEGARMGMEERGKKQRLQMVPKVL